MCVCVCVLHHRDVTLDEGTPTGLKHFQRFARRALVWGFPAEETPTLTLRFVASRQPSTVMAVGGKVPQRDESELESPAGVQRDSFLMLEVE